VTLALIGSAPDLDLLIGRHSNETHSLGVAVVIATLAALWRWPVAASRARIFVVVLAAWMTHPLLDAFGEDTSPPLGIEAFWPMTTAHFIAPHAVFTSIYRQWRESGFFAHNLYAMLRELLILGPLAVAVGWWRGVGRGQTRP
jgi:membrane-bound metal-dependent hydrolase YbcI (DUF457 family)